MERELLKVIVALATEIVQRWGWQRFTYDDAAIVRFVGPATVVIGRFGRR